MGLPDLYPFVLGAGAAAKLCFVQQLIAAARMKTLQREHQMAWPPMG
jgi:hypothetical protein